MPRPEITGRKVGPVADKAAVTIGEFCRAHSISESFYYKIRKLGLGPRETRMLDKVLISAEAAAAWRAPEVIT